MESRGDGLFPISVTYSGQTQAFSGRHILVPGNQSPCRVVGYNRQMDLLGKKQDVVAPSRGRIGAALMLVAILAIPSVWADETVEDTKILRVLGRPDAMSPFLFLDEERGVDGFAYQLLRSFARSMGAELEFVRIDHFDDLIPALLRGEGDIAAGALTITNERAAVVDFSVPYFPVLEWIIADQDSPVLESSGDLAGKIGSTVPGTSLEARLKSLEGVAILAVDSREKMYESIIAGEADFTVADMVAAIVALSNYPELKKVLELPGQQHYGFAMAPGNSLVPVLDEFLTATTDGDSYYRLVLRFLGPGGVEAIKSARGQN